MALTDKLTAIANAIRAKTGKSDSLTLDQMPTEIEGITGGGGGSSADERVKYVTFVYEENGETKEYSYPVISGDTCHDPAELKIINPKKASEVDKTYSHIGWSSTSGGQADANILENITADKTVYGVFKVEARKYTITWLDDDGSVLTTTQVPYGTVPSYTPSKDGAVFGGWTPTPVAVTGNATYTVVWSTIVASGNCGANTTNVTWELDSAGTLTLSGSGKMKDYKNPNITPASAAPWYTNYRKQVKKVVVGNGITHIGDYTLYYLENAESISLPDTVTSIGNSAIYYAKILTSLVLPKNLVSISEWGLSSNYALTSITIPSKVTSIGKYALQNAPLTSAIFENPNGWWVSTDSAATSGEAVTVTDPETAATLLKSTYKAYYWKRS